MTTPSPSPSRPLLRRPAVIGAALAAVAGIAGAALYGGSGGGNGRKAECRAAQAIAERVKPLAKGEVAALQVAREPSQPADFSFNGPEGRAVTLADFRGRTVLLNLWATWCVPCRKEMPALDGLQAKLGGEDFEVVAVNMDNRNLDKPKAWLAENGIRRLGFYADPDGKVFQALRTQGQSTGLPTTVLVGADGCVIAHLAGPAEWASDDAVTFVKAALGR
jgi:thiol-disulfide isomerase/thioredoxin